MINYIEMYHKLIHFFAVTHLPPAQVPVISVGCKFPRLHTQFNVFTYMNTFVHIFNSNELALLNILRLSQA